MANISITSVCNSNCSYCFAGNQFVAGTQYMSTQQFEDILQILHLSHIKQVVISGGEPTLHPDFLLFIEKAIHEGFFVMVFSNGKLQSPIIDELAKYEDSQIQILVNITSDNQPCSDLQSYHELFEKLGAKIILGVNILKQIPTGFDELPKVIETFNLSRNIRVSLAHPIFKGDNQFLHPKYYNLIGKELYACLQSSDFSSVKIEFDCGFVPCMFPSEMLDTHTELLLNIGKNCSPIIDISPQGKAFSCYPLVNLSEPLPLEGLNLKDLEKEFQSYFELFSTVLLYKECNHCWFRDNKCCNGGCLSVRLTQSNSICN